nr:hypothetical protein [uncultured Mucilaginibacter sp.]
MLKISIPAQPGFSRGIIEKYGIPHPLSGTDTEVNGDVILLFENEETAVAYLDELEEHAGSVDGQSPAKNIISLIVSAISTDEFVQAYLQ